MYGVPYHICVGLRVFFLSSTEVKQISGACRSLNTTRCDVERSVLAARDKMFAAGAPATPVASFALVPGGRSWPNDMFFTYFIIFLYCILFILRLQSDSAASQHLKRIFVTVAGRCRNSLQLHVRRRQIGAVTFHWHC